MKKALLAIPLLALVLMGAGCSGTETTADVEQELTEANQANLLEVQPPTTLTWSLERDNINRRTNLWNDPNKVSYIYLIDYGKVMAFYVIKGKVSSVNSQITNPEQVVGSCDDGDYSTTCENSVLPSPAEDGSYGTNGDAIYFFTTDGVYVEWAGHYMLADQALQLSTPPAIVRNIE